MRSSEAGAGSEGGAPGGGSRTLGDRLRALGRWLGRAQTALVLGLLYYLVGAPYALVVRLLGRDPLTPPPEDGSYWRDRPEKERTLESYLRQY